MDSVVSGLIFLILGSLSLFSGISTRAWRPEESRYRIGAILVGLGFMTMGILALVGLIEIKDGW
jgi:hypothetical protein